MEERLYLFEVLIDSIYFDESVTEIPQKKQIVVSVKLGNIVTLEIRSETLPNRGEGGNKRLIDFKSGKSHLMPILQEELLQALNSQNLEVTVGVRGDVIPIGSSGAPWDDTFKEMVQASHEEFVTPASILDDFCLMEGGAIKGNVQLFLRLSCFGKSIQTQFEVLQESGNKQFLFKTPNMATTFICSKYGAGTSTDFLPIATLYNAGYIRNAERGGAPSGTNKSASWTAVMEQHASSFDKRSSIQSECLFPEYLNMVAPVKDSAITFDIASLRIRPEEEKFVDFLTGKRFGELEESIHSFSIADEEGNERVIYYFDDTIKKDEGGRKESKACQCPKSPAYCKHVYAAIEKYEKTHPDVLVFGKRVKYDKLKNKNKDTSSENKSDSLLRLRGGNDESQPYVHKKAKGCYNPNCRMAFKLRSVGISQFKENNTEGDEEDKYFCADFYCPESTRRNVALQVKFSEEDIPSCFFCHDRYCPAAKMFKRLGLGPLAVERCQGTLYGPVEPPVQYALSQTYGTFDTYGPYGIFSKTNTPYMQGEGKVTRARPVLRLRGGGTTDSPESDSCRLRAGAPWKSPIAECQEIMEQFDKILGDYRDALDNGNKRERDIEQYMEPSTTANCGHPRCTYISEPALKPIHWDCPEPLPIGICRNPKCPYLPEDLKRIGKILASRGYNNEDDNRTSQEIKSAPEFAIDGQQCPFYNPPKIVNMMQFCNLSLPNMKKSFSCCSNPNCPLKGIVSSCSNPDCPFAHGEVSRPCSNPDCPFKIASLSAPCSNPDCPLRVGKLSDAAVSVSEPCSNPDCPFKNAPDVQESDESCHNPDCPFKKKESSNEVCQNPDCPFRTKDVPVWADVCDLTSECKCDNPNCPAHKETCSNPECPFNVEKGEVCGNPNCPYKSRPSTKKKGVCGSPHRSVCGDKTCPFHEEGGEDKPEEKGQQQSTVGGGDGLPQKPKDKDNKIQTQVEGTTIEEGALEYTKGDRSSRYDMVPCTLTTCRYMGGKLKCVDCATLTEGRRHAPCPKICPGDLRCPLAIAGASALQKGEKKPESEKKALRKARKQFAYHFGDNYPGIHRGHKHCVISPFNVPPKMGWLWNVHTPCMQLRPRKGWRPGAIGKTILEAIQAHRRSQNMAPLEEGKVRRRKKKFGGDESETELVRPKPTLQIKRKEGIYYITMNPLKDPRSLVPNENPYMETTPLQFRIMKTKDTNEYKSCVCNDQGIVYEPESSSSDSELDIEFTPPAGIIRPERFVKTKDVIHIDTQYNAQDIAPPPNERQGKGKEDNGKDKKKDAEKKKDADKKKDKGKGDGKDKKKEKKK